MAHLELRQTHGRGGISHDPATTGRPRHRRQLHLCSASGAGGGQERTRARCGGGGGERAKVRLCEGEELAVGLERREAHVEVEEVREEERHGSGARPGDKDRGGGAAGRGGDEGAEGQQRVEGVYAEHLQHSGEWCDVDAHVSCYEGSVQQYILGICSAGLGFLVTWSSVHAGL